MRNGRYRSVGRLRRIRRGIFVWGYRRRFICSGVLPKKSLPEKTVSDSNQNGNSDGLFLIAVASVSGTALGGLKIPGFNHSLGTAGGILIAGIVCGMLVCKLTRFKNGVQHLSVYRNLGLLLFFVGNGISARENLNMLSDMKWFVYGANGYLYTCRKCFGLFYFQKKHSQKIVRNSGGYDKHTGIRRDFKKNRKYRYNGLQLYIFRSIVRRDIWIVHIKYCNILSFIKSKFAPPKTKKSAGKTISLSRYNNPQKIFFLPLRSLLILMQSATILQIGRQSFSFLDTVRNVPCRRGYRSAR